MTRYRAIDIIKNEIECVNRQDTCEHKCADCELVLPDIEIFEAYDMAIKALSQEPTEKPMCDRNICISNEYNGIGCDECIVNKAEQEPYICDTCKHKGAGWDTEPCDGCCGNHSGYEPCDDAISRKDIQDYIAKYLSQYLYEDVRQAVEVIDAYIGDMPSVTQKSAKDYLDMADRKAKKIKDALTVMHMSGKWIPVSERLPKNDEDILVCSSRGAMEVCYYHIDDTFYPTEYADLNETGWYNEDDDALGFEPIAWMPLPPCYEPQESEDKCKNCEYYHNPDYTRCHKCKAESEDKE